MNTETIIILGVIGYFAYQQYSKTHTRQSSPQNESVQNPNYKSQPDLQVMPGPNMSFIRNDY